MKPTAKAAGTAARGRVSVSLTIIWSILRDYQTGRQANQTLLADQRRNTCLEQPQYGNGS